MIAALAKFLDWSAMQIVWGSADGTTAQIEHVQKTLEWAEEELHAAIFGERKRGHLSSLMERKRSVVRRPSILDSTDFPASPAFGQAIRRESRFFA
jgi:hypothetical protein